MLVKLLKKSKKTIRLYKRGSMYFAYHKDIDWTTEVGEDRKRAMEYYRVWVVRNAIKVIGKKYGQKKRIR